MVALYEATRTDPLEPERDAPDENETSPPTPILALPPTIVTFPPRVLAVDALAAPPCKTMPPPLVCPLPPRI